MRRRSVRKRQKTPQQFQLLLAEPGNPGETIRPREHAEQRQKKHLVERIDDLPRLPTVRQATEITQKRRRLGDETKIRFPRRVHRSHLTNQCVTTDSAIQPFVAKSFTRLPWLDAAHSLRNGPQSAGSNPGPACYGRGGENPTNCDANVVLGRLSDQLAGGRVTLDKALAAEAIRKGVAEPLKISVEDAAISILKVANANMADAVRLLSIRRGYDPRDFALVAFGGAGPLHGAALAKDLSIPVVLIPPNPGVTSALGCLLVDIQHDISQMYLAKAEDVDIADLEATFRRLEVEGRERLRAEGVAPKNMVFKRKIDMRYHGQWRALSTATSSPVTSLDASIAHFHEEHGREHNYSRPGAPVEIYRVSVTATGVTPKVKFAEYEPVDEPATPSGERLVRFDEAPEPLRAAVYNRDSLKAGMKVHGPAVIEQLDSTVIVPPDLTAEVDRSLTLVIRIPQG